MSKSSDTITLAEAAQILGLSKGRVSKLASAGALRCTRIAHIITFSRADVVAFSKKKRPRGRPPKQ